MQPLLLLTHAVMHPRAGEAKPPGSTFLQQHPILVIFVEPLQGLLENSPLSQLCCPVPTIPVILKQKRTGLLEASCTSSYPGPAFMVLLTVEIFVQL